MGDVCTGEILPVAIEVAARWIHEEQVRDRGTPMGLGRGSEGQMPEKKFVPGVVPGQDVSAASQHHGRNGLVQ